MGQNFDFIHFQHFNPFFVILWKISYLKKVDVYTFWGEGGLWMCVMYTHLNIDSYGQSLSKKIFWHPRCNEKYIFSDTILFVIYI